MVAQEEEYEEQISNLRSKAAELLLREEYRDSIQAYTEIISLCQDIISRDAAHFSKLQKALCLAFSSRAEARSRLSEFSKALKDCEEALSIEKSHFRTLLCKGRILMSLNRYNAAMNCFRASILKDDENLDAVSVLIERCKRLEVLSRSGAIDVSDWVLGGFQGKVPELAEYIGAVEIKQSEISGRGLFVTKSVESGAVLFANRAVAVDRAIMPQDSGESAQLAIWKNFIEKVIDSVRKCNVGNWMMKLSAGEDDEGYMEVPDIREFMAEGENVDGCGEEVDKGRLMSILDVNSVVENDVSANVLGENGEYQGVGLWVLASFVNHSCDPNVRRLHIGDHVVVHAARDLKAGEELTFAYFDVLRPMSKRREMARNWGFKCTCKRCEFEECLGCKQELREIEVIVEKGLVDMGSVVYRLEEGMRRWMVRGKGKGYLRASFWEAYWKLFGSEKMMRRWGRKVPTMECVVDTVVDAVGCDEKIMRVLMEGLKRGVILNGVVEMEKVMKLGRGVYGKVMKKQAIKRLCFGSTSLKNDVHP